MRLATFVSTSTIAVYSLTACDSGGGASPSAGGNFSTGQAGDATNGSTSPNGGNGATTPANGAGGTSNTGSDKTNGGGTTTNHCNNSTQDADETGIDCGGASCPSCNADYKINPPDSCQNQFYFENCTPGDASSKCGGVCQPRNACENAPSKDGKVGFACSRYMMFSPMMIQAAKDDSTANGWPNASDPPFFYAVVGHDTNSGGIDQGMTGTQPCCECYQLVFTAPFNEGDAANNQSPVPKPLVVQVFNIGATTESFDLYMGAGGFGAFNACMDGSIQSSAGYSLYDNYPTFGQSNDGGVKFRNQNLTECRTSTNERASTPTSISSDACQNKIAEYCNQASSSKSASLTQTTRESCIRSNQLDTLYHQNWGVLAKRVECPTNLTRVTGCKLAPEPGLPKVDANVTTAAQAQSAGFLSGYHTTTMQDCCKPACSWIEKVGGKEANKKADSSFASFYACDANDQPMVEP